MDNRTIDEIRKNETVLINELKQKKDIINKAKEYINEYTTKYNIGEERYIDEFDRFASPNKLLEILDNKGE